MMLSCKGPGVSSPGGLSLERLMICFFHESFYSKFVWIISPWASPFKLSSRFVHYPYVSSDRVIDVIDALVKAGVVVKVLTRCLDDSLDPSFMRFMASLKRDERISESLWEYVKNRIDEILDKIDMVLRLRKILGDNLSFDLKERESYGRLHTKLYMNEHAVLFGSANFTWSGIADRGNWECLLYYRRENAKELYTQMWNVANMYFQKSIDYRRCELIAIKKALEFQLLDEPIYTFEDLAQYIQTFKNKF